MLTLEQDRKQLSSYLLAVTLDEDGATCQVEEDLGIVRCRDDPSKRSAA